MDPQEDGQRRRAHVVKCLDDLDNKLEQDQGRIKFLCKLNDDEKEELLTYNQIVDFLNRDAEQDTLWRYKRIVAHQGPLKPGHKDYMGSKYNIMLEWEDGQVTQEPLSIIAKDDPVTCAIYAKENGLLEKDGWRQFRGIAKREKKFFRMVKQALLRSYRAAPKFKYGVEIPRDYDHAMQLDRQLNQTKWADATALEMTQIDDYECFKDLGHKSKVKIPEGYKCIRVHLVYDCKHDGRHKARLVADGHLTDVPLESVYSGVVSLRSFRIVMFLAELNGLELHATDIGNAYLESYTQEKVCIIAGPEFGDRKDHVLIIQKALYGLRSSGKRWHEKFADCMGHLGFKPCKAEPDVWMRRNGDIYEYVAVYVDDLAFAVKDPEAFLRNLSNEPFKFKLKGSGPIKFHLGMDFERDQEGVLCMAPKKYIEKMIAQYHRLFGEYPKQNVSAPIEKGDQIGRAHV